MKRNWYAIAILVLLAAGLLGCQQYVSAQLPKPCCLSAS